MTKTQHLLDIQAVVLCGSGHRLHPLVDEELLPKCMLPIMNKPMLHYPLTLLTQAGITDIIVIAHTNGGQKVQNYLTRIFEGGKVELVLLDEYCGTMDALLFIKDKIKNDLLVLSCDLMMDYPLNGLIDTWRISKAKMMALLSTTLPSNFGQQPKESTEPKHRLSDEGGIIVGLADGIRSVIWAHKDDLNEDGEMIKLQMSLLTKYPRVKLRTDLNDVHVYLFRKELFLPENIEDFGRFFSIREDFIPRLVKRQIGVEDRYSCEVVLVEKGNYCLRANTLSSLAECSKQLVRLQSTSPTPNAPLLISQAAEIGTKAQIGSDSMIGDHSKIGEKSSVKRSVVGNRVSIGNNVKISNSIIFDYVVIEDGAKIEGSIIGMKAVVGEKCQLKDCDVANEHKVEKETNLKGEIIGASREIYLDDDNQDSEDNINNNKNKNDNHVED